MSSQVAQLVKNPPAMQETPQFDSWVGKIPWRRDRLPTPVFLGFPGGSDSRESTCKAEDLGLIPGLGRSPGGGRGNPLQDSCLQNPCGHRSLAGCSPWCPKELDTTEGLSTYAVWLREKVVPSATCNVFRSCGVFSVFRLYYKLSLLYHALELQFVQEILIECYCEVKSTSCFVFTNNN